jgi:hypothetical protein
MIVIIIIIVMVHEYKWGLSGEINGSVEVERSGYTYIGRYNNEIH